ncbi:MAG: hypothetical protein V9E94_14060 [Microthrixaceae bacterium]
MLPEPKRASRMRGRRRGAGARAGARTPRARRPGCAPARRCRRRSGPRAGEREVELEIVEIDEEEGQVGGDALVEERDLAPESVRPRMLLVVRRGFGRRDRIEPAGAIAARRRGVEAQRRVRRVAEDEARRERRERAGVVDVGEADHRQLARAEEDLRDRVDVGVLALGVVAQAHRRVPAALEGEGALGVDAEPGVVEGRAGGVARRRDGRVERVLERLRQRDPGAFEQVGGRDGV